MILKPLITGLVRDRAIQTGAGTAETVAATRKTMPAPLLTCAD
jgi:hypothetical protein